MQWCFFFENGINENGMELLMKNTIHLERYFILSYSFCIKIDEIWSIKYGLKLKTK